MSNFTRLRHDPIALGVLAAGNGVALVCLGTVWIGKAIADGGLGAGLWPLALLFVLVPLHGDAHRRFWNHARTEWLHAFGFVSRERLATACVVQDIVGALLRAGLIVTLVQVERSTREGASTYSWFTLGCSSWIGQLVAWAGLVALVRGSWSVAMNVGVPRRAQKPSENPRQRGAAKEDEWGWVFWDVLGVVFSALLIAALLQLILEGIRSRMTTWRGTLLIRGLLILVLVAVPCAAALWLGRGWILPIAAALVLVALWATVREKEFGTVHAPELDPAENGVVLESASREAAVERTRAFAGRVEHVQVARNASPRRSSAQVVLWNQFDRRRVLLFLALVLIAATVCWRIESMSAPTLASDGYRWLLLVPLLVLLPGRLFRWTSTGAQADFLVAHGQTLATLRRVELLVGAALVAAVVILFCLACSGPPTTWGRWSFLLLAISHVLVASNATPVTAKARVLDWIYLHAVLAGFLLTQIDLGRAPEDSAPFVPVMASGLCLASAALWLRGWWWARDERGLRALEARYAERA